MSFNFMAAVTICGDAGSCIPVISIVWVLTIWYPIGLVLWYSSVFESVLPLQRLRAWSRVLGRSIYSFPLVRHSPLLSAGVLHALLCLKVYSWCIHRERFPAIRVLSLAGSHNPYLVVDHIHHSVILFSWPRAFYSVYQEVHTQAMP